MKPTEQELLDLGFYKLPHFTISDSIIFDLPNNRTISVGNLGTPNEMVVLTQSDYDNYKKITDVITLHNYDYHRYITLDKIKEFINVLNY
jgi:hypothetical protein